MTEHKLAQEPDTLNYGDGLEPWSCMCGETFQPGDIEAAFLHGFAYGQKTMEQEKTLIYVSVSGGIAETERHGPAEVVLIDWDEVTPKSYLDPAYHLEAIEDAVQASLKLPKETMIQNERAMLDWLRDNILDFPENEGYGQARETEAEIVKILSDNGAHP